MPRVYNHYLHKLGGAPPSLLMHLAGYGSSLSSAIPCSHIINCFHVSHQPLSRTCTVERHLADTPEKRTPQ